MRTDWNRHKACPNKQPENFVSYVRKWVLGHSDCLDDLDCFVVMGSTTFTTSAMLKAAFSNFAKRTWYETRGPVMASGLKRAQSIPGQLSTIYTRMKQEHVVGRGRITIHTKQHLFASVCRGSSSPIYKFRKGKCIMLPSNQCDSNALPLIQKFAQVLLHSLVQWQETAWFPCPLVPLIAASVAVLPEPEQAAPLEYMPLRMRCRWHL